MNRTAGPDRVVVINDDAVERLGDPATDMPDTPARAVSREAADG
jgi:hypothetical protein